MNKLIIYELTIRRPLSRLPTDVDSARRGEKHIAQNVFARINSVINEL